MLEILSKLHVQHLGLNLIRTKKKKKHLESDTPTHPYVIFSYVLTWKSFFYFLCFCF